MNQFAYEKLSSSSKFMQILLLMKMAMKSNKWTLVSCMTFRLQSSMTTILQRELNITRLNCFYIITRDLGCTLCCSRGWFNPCPSYCGRRWYYCSSPWSNSLLRRERFVISTTFLLHFKEQINVSPSQPPSAFMLHCRCQVRVTKVRSEWTNKFDSRGLRQWEDHWCFTWNAILVNWFHVISLINSFCFLGSIRPLVVMKKLVLSGKWKWYL